MSSVIANADFENWLGQLKATTEIRDATGKVLGIYTPSSLTEEEQAYEKARQLFDRVDMERIFAEQHGKGRPLAEIWKDLEARENRP